MKLKDYIQGKRHGKEANRLEHEAMNDPFLQDAIDGFDTVPGDHYAAIQELEKQLLQKTEQKKRIIPNRRWTIGVAATIILLLGIGSLFLLDRRAPESIAFKVPKTSFKNKTDSIPTITMNKELENKVVTQNITKQNIKSKSGRTSQISSKLNDISASDNQVSYEVETMSSSITNSPIIETDKVHIKSIDSVNQQVNSFVAKNVLSGKVSGLAVMTTDSNNPEFVKDKSKLNLATVSRNKVKSPIKITGKIVDENGEPVVGASVKIRGQYDGTITDMNGNFVLNSTVTDKDILEANYIGYEKKELALTDNLNEIKLKPSQLALNEVVVIGYGTQRKSSMTGAVSSPKKSFGKSEFIEFVKKESKTGLCDGKGGTIQINFYIDKSGKPTEIKFTQSPCKEAEDELIRLLNSSPKWTTVDQKIKLKMELK